MSAAGGTGTLDVFARFIRRSLGLHFTKERIPELMQKMTRLATEAGHSDVESYLLRLMSEPLTRDRLDMLVATLTIGETYFLRDPKSYQVFRDDLLPELIAARRRSGKRLRIWSAGCSTGEEPYTIAILLRRALVDLKDWEITLLATDINREALERARRGVYSQWSFRNAPSWLMEYFSRRDDGRYEIAPAIREMVRFRELNLAGDRGAGAEEPAEMDFIFCRNVMLYFGARETGRTMSRFHAALRDSGRLFIAPAELNHSLIDGFSVDQYDGAFVLRKTALGAGVTAGGEAAREPRQLGRPAAPPGGGFSPRSHAKLGESPALSAGPASAKPSLRMEPPSAAAPKAARGADGSSAVTMTEITAAAAAASEGAASEAVPASATAAPGPEAPYAAPGGGRPARTSSDALSLYRGGEYRRAAEAALDQDEAQGEQPEALVLAARSYANLGDLPRARACCERAIARDRLSASSHYLLSIILEQQGDRAAAVKSLRNALFIDDDYLVAYLALANLNLSSGDRKEARRNFKNALRLLEKCPADEVLPDAEGMSAGALAQAIRGMGLDARG